MSGPITWDALVGFLALAGALAGVWWRIEARIRFFEGRVQKTRDDLNNYKLEVAEKYASVTHLKDVESRMVAALASLTKEVHELRGELADMFKRRRAAGSQDS